jgi:hypothetical protein
MLTMDYLDGMTLSKLGEVEGLSERQRKAAARRILTRLSEVREREKCNGHVLASCMHASPICIVHRASCASCGMKQHGCT